MCHCRPRDLVVKYLEYSYLQKFLISPMFKNYIKELIGTITVSSDLSVLTVTSPHHQASPRTHAQLAGLPWEGTTGPPDPD